MLYSSRGRALGRTALLFCLAVLSSCQHAAVDSVTPAAVATDASAYQRFESDLSALMHSRNMAGLSAGIVKDGELVWAKGFGFADVEGKVPATPDTPYRIDTCSQVFASVLIMRLVEEGLVALEDPMANYPIHPWSPDSTQGALYASKAVQVRHVLSNTAQGTPGTTFRYAPEIFADLTWVVEQGSGYSYPHALDEYILRPLALAHSVPGPQSPGFDTALAGLAKPYDAGSSNPLVAAYRVLGLQRLFEGQPLGHAEPGLLAQASEDARRDVIGAAYTSLYGVNASVGVVSSVTDLACFDAALDAGTLITPASRDLLFAPAQSPEGVTLPMGLGWFVQRWESVTLVWQFGEAAPSISALYLKVPERGLTFLALANTDRLCAGYGLSNGDILQSPFARLFVDAFVTAPKATDPGSVEKPAPRKRVPPRRGR
ncbi:MAG: beta-lactamase family protein [Candidatus Hydrogenedentes bacterium]|nr:beta-lactamase family protein [Candidatus Hydrogenedentota bacterium]